MREGHTGIVYRILFAIPYLAPARFVALGLGLPVQRSGSWMDMLSPDMGAHGTGAVVLQQLGFRV